MKPNEQFSPCRAWLARTLKEFIEISAEFTVPNDHPLMAWLVEHSATLLNLFKRTTGSDGLTAYCRWRGRHWRVPFPPFGDLVEYQRRSLTKKCKRYTVGIFWGIKIGTMERIVIKCVQRIHRKPEAQGWSSDKLLEIDQALRFAKTASKSDSHLRI